MYNKTGEVHWLREFHFYYEIAVFIFSWVLGWTVLFFILHKTPKSFKGYSNMILVNTVIDLLYSLVDVVSGETVDLHGGILYMFPANPYFPTDYVSARFISAFWIFSLYLTILALPMQFMYRYGQVCRDKPYSHRTFVILGVFSMTYLTVHCYLFRYTFNSPSDYYTNILAENPLYTNSMPSDYIAGDAREINAMFWHFVDCDLIIIVSYGAVFFFGNRISATLKKNMGQLSRETAAAQKHITRIMLLQALYPLISLCIPTGAIALYPLIAPPGAMIQLGFFGCISMNLIPVLNPLSVLLVIPMYRRVIVGFLTKGRINISRNTSTGMVSKVHSSQIF